MPFVMFISKLLGQLTSVCPHRFPLRTRRARRVGDGECKKFGEVLHVRLIATRPRQASGKQFTFVLFVHGDSPVNGLRVPRCPSLSARSAVELYRRPYQPDGTLATASPSDRAQLRTSTKVLFPVNHMCNTLGDNGERDSLLIGLTLHDAMIRAKKKGRSDCGIQPSNFAGDFRIPSIAQMMLSISSSTFFGQPLASSFFAKRLHPG